MTVTCEGRYEAWGIRPEGNFRVSCQDDLATAFGDAWAAGGSADVYDTVERRWVSPVEAQTKGSADA